MATTSTRPAASRPNSFARDAVHLEFRARDARHFDDGAFVDRAPAPIKEPLGRGISALSHAPFPPEVPAASQ